MNRRNFLKGSLTAAASPLLLGRAGFAQTSAPGLPLPPAGADGWISLINDRDLTGWYTMLQKSGKNVAQNKGMVAIEEGMLHIMGNTADGTPAEPGYLATNQEFENVHIRVEYKWGMKRFAPRLMAKRDNGVLYALVGEDKVWPRCVECQIEEGDVGDYFLVDGVRGIQANHANGFFGGGLGPDGWPGPVDGRTGTHHSDSPSEPRTGRLIKDGNFENVDEWNVVEVIWQGDRSAHIVNGVTVNAVSGLQQPDPQNPGQYIPLTRGKIAIELEFAEIWYRRIEVKSLV